MNAALKSGWERLRANGAPALPPAFFKNLAPLVLLAAGLTAVVLMFLWNAQAGYKPLFGAREKVATADMMSVLEAERIPYRVHPDSGQVLVPEKSLGKVRMLLAAKGVTAKLPAGLELMDRNDPLGVSQFVQDIRFRRGLEGELAQSIAALDAVESARVHLSIAKSTSFVISDGTQSSASVVVALKPGHVLAPEQIAAIVNLVAGSVASLTPQRVSLVDQAGNLLSAHIDLSQGPEPLHGNEAAKRYQEATLRSLRDLLTPVLGEDNFKASVTAEIDDDRIEETLEQFGADPKVTAEAVRDEQDRALSAIGVPGSLSNRPVNATPADTPPNEANTARKNATTRQYAYDRSIKQIKRSRSRLSKLNVSVVLNSAAAPKGAADWSKQDLAYIENILANGLGINAERGDRLAVSALAFRARPEPPVWWQQRDNLIDMGTPLAYLVGALLCFLLVVRPLLRSVQKRLAAGTPPLLTNGPALTPVVSLAGKSAQSASGAEHSTPAISPNAMPVVPLLEDYDLPPPGSPVDVMVNHLRVLASKEPERVAEVVKQWVQKHGRPE
ncbi:flagellar M-ring protein FliF [Rhodococcus sp. SRB_17]|uniref:flagellar basal-body MS-ring/collar protein FliF n=1 Tax=Acidovorax sp. SRB_24 TaxID=1962700 RepID=UPI00145DBE70|nr:flagellar M-ring protein FliF [Acidovorax sp. SRB_24]NMM76374.1 flagellar M-ring protein FliF [Acidovorax sp. SRB_24]NMM84886.1 flagellar M-ring protein FliF [Rhodococcus sp. SRB_17]